MIFPRGSVDFVIFCVIFRVTDIFPLKIYRVYRVPDPMCLARVFVFVSMQWRRPVLQWLTLCALGVSGSQGRDASFYLGKRNIIFKDALHVKGHVS